MKIEARFVSNQSTKALIVVLFYLYESSNLYHLVSMISQSCTLWSLWNRLSLFRLYVVSWFCKLCTYLPTYLPTAVADVFVLKYGQFWLSYTFGARVLIYGYRLLFIYLSFSWLLWGINVALRCLNIFNVVIRSNKIWYFLILRPIL